MELSQRVCIVGLLLFGTVNSLFSKIVYGLKGPGRDGSVKYFTKPWANTTLMFLAMSLCLPFAYYLEYKAKKHARSRADSPQAPLLGEQDTAPEHAPGHGHGRQHEQKQVSLKQILLLGVPTMFDLTATALMSIGLLWVTASVYQMMRGAELLFAAVFSVIFLHRPLVAKHYVGIALCTVGIALVGAASLLGNHESPENGAEPGPSANKAALGMMLIIVSQAVQAAQVTVEDFAMEHIGFQPLEVVGYEGILGSALMLGVFLPVVQLLPGEEGTGIHEDSLDTWHMITHSSTIASVLAVSIVALTIYNVAGMYVTEDIGAAARTVLETTRTLFVWLADLALYYSPLGGPGRLGEPWDRWSYLQALGFGVLVAGTLVYGHGDDQVEAREAARAPHTAKESWSGLKATLTMRRLKQRKRFYSVALVAAAVTAFERGSHHGHHHV